MPYAATLWAVLVVVLLVMWLSSAFSIFLGSRRYGRGTLLATGIVGLALTTAGLVALVVIAMVRG